MRAREQIENITKYVKKYNYFDHRGDVTVAWFGAKPC